MTSIMLPGSECANELFLGFCYMFYKVVDEVGPGLVLIVVAEVNTVQLHAKQSEVTNVQYT